MKSIARKHHSKEVELKLLLVTSSPQGLRKQLAQTAPLRRSKPRQQILHSVYFDTPDQLLRQQRAVLRIRRVASADQSVWIQTLKTGASGASALSARGEWECQVNADTPSLSALAATPWEGIDPDSRIFCALTACFVTSFERTSWRISTPDGSEIEVALDLGQVQSGEQSTSICELELELLAGEVSSLFAVAQQIAASVALMPVGRSKAERGFCLSSGTLDHPCFARMPVLEHNATLQVTAQKLLREVFYQFTANLDLLRRSDDAEVVHQARVGWRRFKSALRLFGSALPDASMPSMAALEPLLRALGLLRNLDVALHGTLPLVATSYVASDAQRGLAWDALQAALTAAAQIQRAQVRSALLRPEIGAALLSITRYIEELTLDKSTMHDVDGVAKLPMPSLRGWARHRVGGLHRRLKLALADADNLSNQHRMRIRAKRLRYATEWLQILLPKRRARRWIDKATDLQSRLGETRDMHQAYLLACQYQADPGLLEFLRGFGYGKSVKPG